MINNYDMYSNGYFEDDRFKLFIKTYNPCSRPLTEKELKYLENGKKIKLEDIKMYMQMALMLFIIASIGIFGMSFIMYIWDGILKVLENSFKTICAIIPLGIILGSFVLSIDYWLEKKCAVKLPKDLRVFDVTVNSVDNINNCNFVNSNGEILNGKMFTLENTSIYNNFVLGRMKKYIAIPITKGYIILDLDFEENRVNWGELQGEYQCSRYLLDFEYENLIKELEKEKYLKYSEINRNIQCYDVVVVESKREYEIDKVREYSDESCFNQILLKNRLGLNMYFYFNSSRKVSVGTPYIVVFDNGYTYLINKETGKLFVNGKRIR